MRRLGAAALTIAAAAALAFGMRCTAAPVGAWWLLVPLLAIAIAAARPGASAVAFRRGWLFGMLFVLADLAWVVVPAAAHLGPALFAVAVVLAALEALPVAIAAWAFARTATTGALGFCLGVPAVYALLEAARASGPLGLPLATLGATQTAGPLAVTLAIAGVPLATFVALASAATLVWAVRQSRDAGLSSRERSTLAGAVAATALALSVSNVAWQHVLATRPLARLARVGIVEAGPVDVGRSFAATARDYAAMTQRLPKDVDFALWPEGVLFLTASDAAAQRTIAIRAAGDFGRPIFAGATLRAGGALHNDLLRVDPHGSIASVYTKRRLVPFGEYQPFAIGGGNRATYDAGTATGAPVRFGNETPFGVLVCYEVVFADLTRDSARSGAGYLVAVLNDTWFAGTDGPDQLAQLLRARAIESGIAVLRADTVPPSGAVDPSGAWTRSPLEAAGTQVVDVPPGILTVYRESGPGPGVVALLAIALATLRGEALRRRRPPYRFS